MTWEQKLQAIQALTNFMETALHMRHPGNWYVRQRGVDIRCKHAIEGRYGNGSCPEEAVSNHWKKLTELKDDECVQASYAGVNRFVRWNGFMWEDVPQKTEAA